MAEALIGRYGGGESISNDDKAALGYGNDATLGDILKGINSAVSWADGDYATLLVTLSFPDGTPISNQQISCNTNTNLVYTTNEIGMCKFKTAYGSATISDLNTTSYIDLDKATDKIVDCPIGDIYSINLQRSRNSSNKKITSTGNIIFSPMLNTVDILCRGADGAGGGAWRANSSMTPSKNTSSSYSATYNGGYGDCGNTSTVNGYSITANKNYNIYIGLCGKNNHGGYGGSAKEGRSITYGYTQNANGGSGGTSSFDSVLSAVGGTGGNGAWAGGNGANIGNANGGSGAVKCWYKVSSSFRWSASTGGETWYSVSTWSPAGAGNPGYIWINNFQYK